MNKLLPFLLLLVIIIACGDDERCPNGISYERNKHLDFLPYNVGDIVYFADSLGNRDTLRVTLHSTNIQYLGGASCIESESVNVNVVLNYDSRNTCNMGFWSNSFIEAFVLSSTGQCVVSSNHQNIRYIDDYEFDDVTYETVYEIDLTAANDAFEKIVIAKNTGFLFFTINGTTRKAL